MVFIGRSAKRIQHWEVKYEKDYDGDIQNASCQNVSVNSRGCPLHYTNVIDVTRLRTEQETDGREGLRSLEVLIANYLSARDGMTIS